MHIAQKEFFDPTPTQKIAQNCSKRPPEAKIKKSENRKTYRMKVNSLTYSDPKRA